MADLDLIPIIQGAKMIFPYLLTFFRFVIGFVFVTSLIGKAGDIPAFTQAITNFRFFPQSFSKPLAYLFLLGEFGTVVAMLFGRELLFWGFLVAMLMFLSFSIALSSVILRKIETTCNCFGPDQKDVNFGHVLRSLGFMICGIGGSIISYLHNIPSGSIEIINLIFVGAFSAVFVLVWMHIGDILQFFEPLRS